MDRGRSNTCAKSNNPVSASDYRPISISNAGAKILEKSVFYQTVEFLSENNSFDKYQSGFRPAHNTTTALVHICDEVRKGMDEGQLTLLVLLDFTKAFDSILHEILYEKLRTMDLSDSTAGWFRSLLSQRTQFVRAGGKKSRWAPVTRGVPQGSSLAPLLFSIYINDPSKVIKHSRYHLYAVDLQIYQRFSHGDLSQTITSLKSDLAAISRWAGQHGLKLDPNPSG